jgi:hypothetical protein
MKITEVTICLHCGCNEEIVATQKAALAPLEQEYTVHWNNRIDRHPQMYASYSELINDSVVSSPSEWVILINDRTHPTVESVKKMISLLESGFACVLLYNVGFMGFSKELIRKIGWWDQRFLFGGWEDRDWVWRLQKANLAIYESQEVQYDMDWKSPLNVVGANLSGQFFDKKYDISHYAKIYQRLPEEQYPEYSSNLGEDRQDISASWKIWQDSFLNIGYDRAGSGPSGSSLLRGRVIEESFRNMDRILFIITQNPEKQGDYLELSILHGLKELLGKECFDIPKKKILYGDFSQSPKEKLHGKGFSILSIPLPDLLHNPILETENVDAIIVGDGHMYGEFPNFSSLYEITPNVWVLDGHDLYGEATRKINFQGEEIIGAQFENSFKRELIEDIDSVYPTGFGIPEHRIREIDFSLKTRMIQKTSPSEACFSNSPNKYLYEDEEEYYDDMASAWFGLSCKKGGWDCLRHYEIIASGSLLLFKDYDKKPPLCSPQFLPCFSYSSFDELITLMNRLIVDDNPTEEYKLMLEKQRLWLYNYGTTKARAKNLLESIQAYL